MKEIDLDKIGKELISFTQKEVSDFLAKHPDKIFYAFAFDCLAVYGEVNLCFNTEGDFITTLEAYQRGRFGEFYQTEDQIKNLRYCTGDWEYNGFATADVFTEEELDVIYDETDRDSSARKEETQLLLRHFSKILLEFCETPEFKSIPKTKDFRILCIDLEEDLEEAEFRMAQL